MKDSSVNTGFEVAVVGSGPSAFFVAEALLRQVPAARIHLFERLPVPFGLVRYGVAPDRQAIKSVTRKFTTTAQGGRVFFHGNVNVGHDLGMEELLAHFHAVILACGAPCSRNLGIPGEELPGSYSSAAFTGWYNGHPDHAGLTPDLRGHEAAVVVGVGNVALDVTRMLAGDPSELSTTDISGPALQSLTESGIRTIHVVGRRGPADVLFSVAELEALVELKDCGVEVRSDDVVWEDQGHDPMVELLAELARRPPRQARRRVVFHFRRKPVFIAGGERVGGIDLARSQPSDALGGNVTASAEVVERIHCGLVVRCIGYRGTPPPGVPFDGDRAMVPNREGRVTGHPAGRLYVSGWIKHGPRGLIGTARRDAVETVRSLAEDLGKIGDHASRGAAQLLVELRDRGLRTVSFQDWLRIDEHEIQAGRTKGKVREKIISIDEMLRFAGKIG